MLHLIKSFLNCSRALLLACTLAASFLAGCTRVELENKADAYNQAIAESNNRQILLNAVRASQRAPMSFVGFGDVSATPNWSGTASGTFNFDPTVVTSGGLTSYSVNPSVSYSGGFSSFSMNNLNNSVFANKLQRRLPNWIVQYFVSLRFPEELVQLIFVQEYKVSTQQHAKIESAVEERCSIRDNKRTKEFCEQFDDDREALKDCPPDYHPGGATRTILNSGRDRCGMTRFQAFERKLRFLNMALPFTTRSGQGVLYYLGELIAAQNYSTHEFTPKIFVLVEGRHTTVPLFEVRRGVPGPGEAAVAVVYGGESFYIPKPAFGSVDEARSLQVLDLVTQIITEATGKETLPKNSTVTLVQSR